MRDLSTMLFGQKLPPPIEGALERLLVLDRFTQLCEKVQRRSDQIPFVERFLETMNVRPAVSDLDLKLVPKTGPVVVVANHPFGLLEGAVVAALLGRIRPDVKILANQFLAAIPDARQYCIFVDPFGGDSAVRGNHSGLKSSIAWLRQGGLLAVFPAGEVAHLDLKERAVIDPEWNGNVARLIRLTGATALPIYFVGANSPMFQLLGFLHPRVRTALLAHEFLNKHNRTIEMRIGNPIPAAKLRRFEDDRAMIGYLRRRTYLLQSRQASRPARRSAIEPSACGVFNGLMASEVSKLPPERLLVESDQYWVLLANANEIPNVLQEIGRLREITFRQVGEGTGQSVDLDSFDDYYWQLFVWNRATNEVVGAYRLGLCDEIIQRMGPKGLYTWRLFAWQPSFLNRLQPALELGRSFVRPEYQKTYAPLLLLWRGIGQFLVRHPWYKVLFGPVSISAGYNIASRQLMVKFLSTYHPASHLAPLVRARNPFRAQHPRQADDLFSLSASDVEELSALIADIEIDRKGVPVLLKQYLKLGGELVAYHVDRRFANALDGLIVVDLHKTDVRLLERYLGTAGAAAYLNHPRLTGS